MSTLEREENPTLELYPVGKLYKFTEYINSPLKITGLLTVKHTHAHGFVTAAPRTRCS